MLVIAFDRRVALVEGRHGRFLINRHDRFVGRALETYGEYGEIESRLIDRLIVPGRIVVEAGANIGSHTVAMARRVGPDGTVVAIEPQPEVFALLAAQVALNALGNVELHQAACGREAGRIVVPRVDYDADGNFGGVALGAASAGGTPVPLRALDEIVDGRDVGFVKIDVEGMEEDAIAGARATIARSKPRLYVENDRVEKSPGLIAALLGLDYRLYWHVPKLFNPDNFFRETKNIYGDIASFNMICLHASDSMRVDGFTRITAPDQPHPLGARARRAPEPAGAV